MPLGTDPFALFDAEDCDFCGDLDFVPFEAPGAASCAEAADDPDSEAGADAADAFALAFPEFFEEEDRPPKTSSER